MVKNLRLLREENGMSQQSLADLLGTTQQAVYKYEKTADEPDIATLIQLSDIFDITVDFLIGKSNRRGDEMARDVLSPCERRCINAISVLPENLGAAFTELICEVADMKKNDAGARRLP